MNGRNHILTPTGALRAWATILMLIVTFGVALGLTIGYVNKVNQDAERRSAQRFRDICGVIRIIDDRNKEIVPTTPEQGRFIDELHRYRLSLGC